MVQLIVEARVHVDGPRVVFVFNGRLWAPAKLGEVSGMVAPLVTVVTNGRRYICHNATLEEVLAGYEECGAPLGL